MNVINSISILLPIYLTKQLFPINSSSFNSLVINLIISMFVYLLTTLILYLSLSMSTRRLVRRILMNISVRR